MAIDDFYRSTIVFTNPSADGEVVNVVDYQSTVLATPVSEIGQVGELAVEIKQTVEALLMPNLSAVWTLDRVDVFNITQPQFAATTPSGITGAVGVDSVSPRTAVIMSKKTGLRGRSFNGRMFSPSPPEDQQNNGVLEGTFVTIMQAYGDDLLVLTTPGLNEYKMVVFSEVLVDGNQVIVMIVRSDLGSIRGRKQVVS